MWVMLFWQSITRPIESFKGLAITGCYDHNDFCALCWCSCFLKFWILNSAQSEEQSSISDDLLSYSSHWAFLYVDGIESLNCNITICGLCLFWQSHGLADRVT